MRGGKPKRALTVKDRTPPQGVRDACKAGIKLLKMGTVALD